MSLICEILKCSMLSEKVYLSEYNNNGFFYASDAGKGFQYCLWVGENEERVMEYTGLTRIRWLLQPATNRHPRDRQCRHPPTATRGAASTDSAATRHPRDRQPPPAGPPVAPVLPPATRQPALLYKLGRSWEWVGGCWIMDARWVEIWKP